MEGTGSYGAGLARHLSRAGIDVVEVDRPNRQARRRARRRAGKSNTVDAVAAARAALGGTAAGLPKSRDGNVEAIRVVTVARRSAASERIVALNQLRHLAFTADAETRQRFEGLSPTRLVKVAAALRPRPPDPVRYATLLAVRALARRVAYLERESVELTGVAKPLIEATAPGAAQGPRAGLRRRCSLLVAAGDNPERLRSEAAWAHMCGTAPLEASSGKVIRHRLNRGGNRQANSALYRIVISPMSSHQPTRDYLTRRRAEGKSTGEIVRILKRYVAREVYKHLPHPT